MTDPIQTMIALSLAEDVGSGDVTTEALFASPGNQDPVVTAHLVAREAGILAGSHVAQRVFRTVDGRIAWEASATDGDALTQGRKIAAVMGRTSSLLKAERTALNFLQHLSGVATLTRKFVDAVAGTSAKIFDTRKTLPGYRELEKYAVKMGGGENHRQGLYDQYLVKDNHLMGRSITEALMLIQKHNRSGKLVEIEVDRLDQIDEVLRCGADVILLDNFSTSDLKKAVVLIAGRVQTEASGGITLENVLDYAKTGVNRISIGALTHSAPALDIGLDIT